MKSVFFLIVICLATAWFFCDYARTGHEINLVFGIGGIAAIVVNVTLMLAARRSLGSRYLQGGENDGQH